MAFGISTRARFKMSVSRHYELWLRSLEPVFGNIYTISKTVANWPLRFEYKRRFLWVISYNKLNGYYYNRKLLLTRLFTKLENINTANDWYR